MVTSAACDKTLKALSDCVRKHPKETHICRHLEAAAGWCVVATVCPEQVQDVNDCAGVRAGTAPSYIPKRLQGTISLETASSTQLAAGLFVMQTD
ncbi:hypothetical protein WJX73_008486 [Symbiochloris irregularis]|uniref:Uncharacterized protein n=1 Tax=Symbiochloris irregularis TaxID=706552 RepID=A0AAW1Q2Y3_9CHLO